ncbi:MAG: hypothetical protein ACM3UZ_15755 [Acidobacteriota bacterium]
MKKVYVILAILVVIGLPVAAVLYVSRNTAPTVYKARDLGIRFTQAEFTAAQAKLDGILTGKQSTSSFDSRELTSLLIEESRKGAPVLDPQIKINKDNTVEVAGLLAMKRIEALAKSEKSLEEVVFYLGTRHDVPFYAKLKGSIENGHGNMQILQLNIQDSDIPNSMVAENQGMILEMLDKEISAAGISSIKSNGGTVTVQRVP